MSFSDLKLRPQARHDGKWLKIDLQVLIIFIKLHFDYVHLHFCLDGNGFHKVPEFLNEKSQRKLIL